MIWLEHDDSRSYDVAFRVLDGAAAIAAQRDGITSRRRPTGRRLPDSSGKFGNLAGRSI